MYDEFMKVEGVLGYVISETEVMVFVEDIESAKPHLPIEVDGKKVVVVEELIKM